MNSFDNINHELVMRAFRHHTQCKWILLYLERWLKAPLQAADGTLSSRTLGTPQGGVISPLASNLFLHYVFDKWMERTFPLNPWCRYADDGIVHCNSLKEATDIVEKLASRFQECGLNLHPLKTKIVYCKDANRKLSHKNTKFDFLGYTFRGRESLNAKLRKPFMSFLPAVSIKAIKNMRKTIRREWKIRLRVDKSLEQLAYEINPTLRGWFEYYGKFSPHEMKIVSKYLNHSLVRWAQKKYLSLRRRPIRTWKWLHRVYQSQPNLFVHWKIFGSH